MVPVWVAGARLTLSWGRSRPWVFSTPSGSLQMPLREWLSVIVLEIRSRGSGNGGVQFTVRRVCKWGRTPSGVAATARFFQPPTTRPDVTNLS